MLETQAETTAASDESLLARARRRDEAAVRTIVRQNNRRLFRMARAILKDDSEAEDVVQESYVRAFTHLADFRAEAALSTWLTRIVINEAYGRLRRRRPTLDWESAEPLLAAQAQIIPFPSWSSRNDPKQPWRKIKFTACSNVRSMRYPSASAPSWSPTWSRR
jgi:RNA polymerase sigma-70 factor (ECF subfamily)